MEKKSPDIDELHYKQKILKRNIEELLVSINSFEQSIRPYCICKSSRFVRNYEKWNQLYKRSQVSLSELEKVSKIVIDDLSCIGYE